VDDPRLPKTIGLLGGMSWESSIEYERIINVATRDALGGSHSADLVIRSYDFDRIERLQRSGDWDGAGAVLARDARRLQESGAGCVVLCTNTMHRVADAVEAAIDVPLLHIAEATAAAVHSAGLTTVGLLGTAFTMEHEFLRGRLEQRHGLRVLVPDDADRALVHDVIYQELVRGEIRESSRAAYLGVIERLVDAGAGGIISGCTEIELLVGPKDVDVPWLPTAELHALAAVAWSLADDD
jgi:aspartate racemase